MSVNAPTDSNSSCLLVSISMPNAPCPGAGIITLGSISLRILCANPSRFNPAAARIIASYSPASSLANLVSKLPRNDATFNKGNFLSNCPCLRKLLVPTILPAGISARLLNLLLMNASLTSSLRVMAARLNPSGMSIGTSFILCTAKSARPSSRAVSNSLINNPFPPILANGRSRI